MPGCFQSHEPRWNTARTGDGSQRWNTARKGDGCHLGHRSVRPLWVQQEALPKRSVRQGLTPPADATLVPKAGQERAVARDPGSARTEVGVCPECVTTSEQRSLPWGSRAGKDQRGETSCKAPRTKRAHTNTTDTEQTTHTLRGALRNRSLSLIHSYIHRYIHIHTCTLRGCVQCEAWNTSHA